MEKFTVYCRGENVGELSVEREGLYYRIQCRCIRRDGIFRLVAKGDSGQFVIGVCSPCGAYLTLERKLPVKTFRGADFQFLLVGEEDAAERFAPLDEALPTECIRRLEQARFAVRDGRPGLLY